MRDHFATNPGEEHDVNCKIGIRAAIFPHETRAIDPNLGPFFYLNTEDTKAAYPANQHPKQRAWIDKEIHDRAIIPDGFKRITYATQAFRRHREIITPEFVQRGRIDAAKDAQSLIKNFSIASRFEPHKKDSWCIVNGVAIRLDKMLIRLGKDGKRDLSPGSTRVLRQAEKLPDGFLFPENPAYDRFARLYNEEKMGIHHPVLLHFRIAAEPKRNGTAMQPVRVIDLGDYFIERANRKRTDIPTQRVEISVRIKDYKAFGSLKVGQDYFALAHPYHSEYGNGHKTLTQCFNVNRACDLVAMTLPAFAEIIQNGGRRRGKKQSDPQQLTLVA